MSRDNLHSPQESVAASGTPTSSGLSVANAKGVHGLALRIHSTNAKPNRQTENTRKATPAYRNSGIPDTLNAGSSTLFAPHRTVAKGRDDGAPSQGEWIVPFGVGMESTLSSIGRQT